MTTSHRLIKELEEWGALVKNPDGTYAVGPRLAELGMLSPIQRELSQVAAGYMQDVLFATRQIVNLFVLATDQALLLDRIAGTHVGAPIARPGDKLPLHTSAGGKILLAHGSPRLWDACTRQLVRETSLSIVEIPRLQRELERVRERGYATTDEEHSPGAHGLAVPVRDFEGAVTAALGIVTFTKISDTQRIVPALQVASAAITRSLGIPN